MNSIAKKHTLLAMSVSVALGLSSTASALTAGPIVVTSNIGEPLNATIRLGGVRATDVHALTLNLASSAQYAARGVKWLPSHKNLRFRVVPVGAGQYAIAVSSTAPIQQPFIDFLLSIKTPTQDLVREYAAFPKVGVGGESLYNRTATAPSTPAPTAKPLLTQFPASAKVTGWQGKGVAKTETVAATPVSAGSFHGSSYGPIKPGQTLYSIAMEVRPSDDYPMRSVMRAIFNANRHAFASSSLNSLKAGVTLTIPDFGKKNPEPVAAVKRPVHHVTHRTTPEETPAAPTPSVAETPTVTPPVKTEAPKPEPKPVKVTQDDIATVFGKGSPANRPHPDLPVVAPAEENPKAAEQAEAAVKAATQALKATTNASSKQGVSEQAASQGLSTVQSGIQNIANHAQEATQKLSSSTQNVVQNASQVVSQTAENAQDVAAKIGDAANNALNASKTAAQNIANTVGQATSSAVDDVQKAAAQVGKKAQNAAQNAVKSAGTAAKQITNSASETAKAAVQNITKVMPSMPKITRTQPKATTENDSFLTETLFLLPNWQWLAALLGLVVIGGGAGGFYAWKKKKSKSAALSEALSSDEPMLDEDQMAAVMAQIEGMDSDKEDHAEEQEDIDLTESPTQEHFDIENFLDEEEIDDKKISDLDTDFFDDYEDEEINTPDASKVEAAHSDEFDMGELEWEDVSDNALKATTPKLEKSDADDDLFFEDEETIVPVKKVETTKAVPEVSSDSDDLFFEEPTASEVAAAKTKEKVIEEVTEEKSSEKGMDELFMDWTEVDFDKSGKSQEDTKVQTNTDVHDLEDFDFDPTVNEKVPEPAFPEEVTQVVDTVAPVKEKPEIENPTTERTTKEKNSVIEEMEINLELASSFVITGHADRAKAWLEEVIAKGTPEQKKKAEDMLRSIK